MATKKPYTAQPTTTLNYDALMANLNALPGEAAAEEKPSVARRIGDTAVQFGQGAVTGVKMMSDIFGVNNPVSSGLSDVNQALDGLLSATAQGDKQKVAQIMQEAEGKGWGEQVIAGLKAAGVDPVGLAANALGTSLPTMATMLIPGAGPAAVAARMGAGVAMGAGQGVGAVKGQIYDETKRKWLEARATPEQAEAKAQEAAAYGGENTDQMAIGGVLGMGSVLGAERALGKVLHGASKAGPGMLGRVATSTLAETGTEMLQGGQEKFATNTALNRQGFDVDPMSGVIANATLEGAAAAPMGAVAGIPKPAVAAAPGIDPAKDAADTIRATEKLPESGALTAAVNAGVEAKAQAVEAGAPVPTQPGAEQTDEAAPEAVDDPVRDQILALPDGARQDALRAYAVVNRTDVAKGVQQYNRKLLDRLLAENAPPPALGERLTDTDMGSMLGGGGMAGRADPLAGALGMNNEAQANSITNVANVAERRPPMPASDAARMLDEARNRGLDLAVAEHPAGGFVLIPPNWVTPDMAAQGEARLKETIARMQQADAAPVVSQPAQAQEAVGTQPAGPAAGVPAEGAGAVEAAGVDQLERERIDNEERIGKPALRSRIAEGREPKYEWNTQEGIYTAKASDAIVGGNVNAYKVKLTLTADEKRAVKRADSAMDLADTPEERAEARKELTAALRPAVDRALAEKTTPTIVEVQGMATPAPTDILNPAGEPFKTRMAADRAAKKTPGAVVPVEGGFVVRPQESVNVQDVPQAPEVSQATPVVSPPGQAPQAVGTQPAGPAAGVPAEGAGAVEAAGVAPTPTRIGRNNTPLSEGGKPFKTRKAAGDAKKMQPMMRVVTVPGGYALAEKTPAQLAAEERASRRLRNPNTSARGEPIPAHAFIAAAGGLNRAAASDMGVDGNPRIGNRTLFAGQGRGLSMDQATQMLIQDGYLSEGASINDALALIKTSLTRPQYNADGIERIAEAEAQAQFDDYLAAQEDAAVENDEFDPFGPAPTVLDGFSDDMLESSGYDAATDAIKAEVRALLEMAAAQGIDTESIMLEAHEQTRNATEQDYYEAAKSALEAAIAGSNRDRGAPAGSEGQGPGAAAASAEEQGLNQPVALDQQAQVATESVAPEALELAAQTPAEAAAQQEAQEQAAKAEAARQRAADAQAARDEERKRIAQASVRAADSFELGQDPLDSLTGQGSIFDAPAPSAPTAASDDEGRERFTLSIEMFGDVPYRASKPVDAGSGEVVSSRVITTKTKLTAANAQSLGLPKDKGTVYAWRVSVIRRADGAAHSVIEAMATDNGRSPDGEVLAHFKEVENPEAMERIAPAIANAALSDWRAAQPQQAPTTTEAIAQPITRADAEAAKRQAAEDNYLDVLFGGDSESASAAQAAPSKRRIDAKKIVPALRQLADQKRAEADDWMGRVYRNNTTQIDLRGDGPSRQDSMSTNSVNESRRRRAVEALTQQANAASKLADRVENGAIDLQARLDSISDTVDSDMRRDGGKPMIGSSRADMFEGYISNNLLGDDNYGHGQGTVARMLREAYEGQEQPAAQPDTRADVEDAKRQARADNRKKVETKEDDTGNVAMFRSIRTAKSAQTKLSQDAVEKAVASALNRVVGAPKVQVVAAPADAGIDVPPGVIPKGVTLPDGSVLIFSDSAESVLDVFQTVFHELYHRGSKVRFTSNPDYITKMLEIASKDELVQQEVNAWKNTEDGKGKWAEFQERGPMTGERLANFEALAVEEALATMAEKVAMGEVRKPETVIKQMARFIAKVANAWGMNRFALWLNTRSLAESEKFIIETIGMSGGKANEFTNSVLFRSKAEDISARVGDTLKSITVANVKQRATIRAAITKAYGKLLGQLESKGLVTLTQTEDEAIEAAAQARAAKTGQSVEQARSTLRASVKNSVADHGDFDPANPDIRRSADGSIQGFFDPQTGQSFLIADNLTAEAAPGVLMHEVGIHMAADGSMKALFNRAAMMLKLQRGNPFMKAVQDRMDAAGETSGEEAAAYIAEAYENDRANAPASVQRWLADLLAAVKAWMFKKGIMGADRLTVADIAAVARANARSMARDGGATGGQGFGTAFSRAPAGDQTQTDAFKRWFAGSRVVDADGKPLVVYHGTHSSFTEFKPNDALGGGMFFSPSPEEAGAFTGATGSNIMPVYLSAQKVWPKIVRSYDEVKAIRAAKSKGYDAIRVRDDQNGVVNWVVFDPTQVKSATGNNGDFDPANPDIRFSRTTAQSIASSMGDMTPDQEKAYKNVAGVKVVPTVRERMDALKANLGLKLRQGLVDQFAAIKQLDQNAYVQARMSKGTDGTLEAMLMYGKPFMRDGAPDVDVKDGGFAKVLASLKGEQDRWMMWIAAQRAEKLKAEGKENLMTDDDISALKTLNAGKMADGTARMQVYAKALQELNDYNDAMLKLAMDSGLIDQAAYDLMAGQPYVPFYRLMEDGDMKGPKFSSGLTNQKAWQKLKGGTQQLNADLLQNMMLNWSHLLQASAKNRAATATMDAAEKMAVAYKVDADTKGAVKVMRDGSAEYWMVEDPYLLDAISAIHYVPSPLMKPLAKFKQLLTWGVTVNPTFKIRNLIRDSVSAIAQSELGYNPGANVAKGWKLTAKDSQIYASMLASGGLIKFGTQENADRLRAQVAKLGGVVLDKSGAERFFGQIKDLYEVYNEFGDRAENVNRAALYDALIKKGKTHAEAAFMARDLMDFSMGGSAPVVRFLTQTVPFLNARLVGLDKLGRAAMEDPRRFAAVTGAIALASLALLAAYSDDDDWKKREDWDRDAYWWFKVGEQAYRIPKPFEVGAIGTLAERTAELMLSDEMTGKRYMERVSHMLSGTFSFNPVPQAFKPLLDLYANKDSFTGRAIESQADQRLRPQDRYSERTPEVAKFLGGLGLPGPAQLVKGEYSALSPKQVEHLIRGYFSWVGTAAMTVSDFGLRPLAGRGERPDMRLKDVFIAGNFVENLPTGSSRYVTQMYEQSRQVEQAYASYQEAIKAGDTEKAQSIKESAGPLLRNRPAYTAATRQLAEINRTAKRIEADQAMAGAAKRARLTQLEQQRQVIAQRVSRLAAATP